MKVCGCFYLVSMETRLCNSTVTEKAPYLLPFFRLFWELFFFFFFGDWDRRRPVDGDFEVTGES